MNTTIRRARVIAISTLCLALTACGVNNIPTYDEQVTAAWGNVESQYQRRADLIPNLVATVKGIAEQEREVFLEVTKARSRASQINVDSDLLNDPAAFKQFEQTQAALSGALSRLLVTVERYPDIKSNENFLALQTQLEGTENRIAVARRDYVEAVRRYNTELRTIPGRWWASLFYSGHSPKPTFEATTPNAETAPTVEF